MASGKKADAKSGSARTSASATATAPASAAASSSAAALRFPVSDAQIEALNAELEGYSVALRELKSLHPNKTVYEKRSALFMLSSRDAALQTVSAKHLETQAAITALHFPH